MPEQDELFEDQELETSEAAEAVVEDAEEQEQEIDEEGQEQEETDESDETEEEQEEEISAAELKAKLEAQQAELDRLKNGEKKPEPASSTFIKDFVEKTKPSIQKQFTKLNPINVNEDGTVAVDEESRAQEFELMYQMSGDMLTAVYNEKVAPLIDTLAGQNISQKNEIQLLSLMMEDPAVKAHASSIRAELSKLSWKDRNAEDAVLGVYHKLKGKGSLKTPQKKNNKIKARPKAAAALRDLSAGGSTVSRKPGTVRLSSEAEKDFLEMKEESPTLTREKYKAKLDARNDARKTKGLPPLKTWRGF